MHEVSIYIPTTISSEHCLPGPLLPDHAHETCTHATISLPTNPVLQYNSDLKRKDRLHSMFMYKLSLLFRTRVIPVRRTKLLPGVIYARDHFRFPVSVGTYVIRLLF